MTKGGFLIYKCRMCGKEYRNTHVPDIQLSLISVITGNYDVVKHWSGIQPDMLDLHFHNDNTQGVADLIGGRQDADDTNE